MKEPNGSEVMVRINGRVRPYRPGRVVDVLDGLGLDPGSRGIAVAVNGEIVSRSEWKRHEIRPGDEIEVVGAVQGG